MRAHGGTVRAHLRFGLSDAAPGLVGAARRTSTAHACRNASIAQGVGALHGPSRGLLERDWHPRWHARPLAPPRAASLPERSSQRLAAHVFLPKRGDLLALEDARLRSGANLGLAVLVPLDRIP